MYCQYYRSGVRGGGGSDIVRCRAGEGERHATAGDGHRRGCAVPGEPAHRLQKTAGTVVTVVDIARRMSVSLFCHLLTGMSCRL